MTATRYILVAVSAMLGAYLAKLGFRLLAPALRKAFKAYPCDVLLKGNCLKCHRELNLEGVYCLGPLRYRK